jgi:hypothetical protein
MSNNYTFLRTVSGISYFARVWIDAILNSGTLEVIDAIGKNVNPNEGEVDADAAPSWVAAALEGAREAAEYLARAGCIQNGCIVRVVRLVGSVADSREDVIACAAALATWQAVCPYLPIPKPVFERGIWKLRYPKLENVVSSKESPHLLRVEDAP